MNWEGNLEKTKIYYASGLFINWTQKELDKIKEIKNRPGHKQNNGGIPLSKRKLVLFKQQNRKKRDKSIKAMRESGMRYKEISQFFNMSPQAIRYIAIREVS